MFCTKPTCLLVVFIGLCLGSNSDLEKPSILKMSVTNLRNNTDHWVSQMHLEHNPEERENNPWTIDTQHEKTTGLAKISIDVRTRVPAKSILAPPIIIDTEVPGYGCYKIHQKIDLWVDALEICHRGGGHLWIINSNEEAIAVDRNVITKTADPHAWYWIGFHNRYTRGQYLTIYNQTLKEAGYTIWGPGEPSTGECGFFRIGKGLGTGTCVHPRYFICENENCK